MLLSVSFPLLPLYVAHELFVVAGLSDAAAVPVVAVASPIAAAEACTGAIFAAAPALR